MAWKKYADIDGKRTVEIIRNADGTYDMNLYAPDEHGNVDLTDWVLDVGRDEGPQDWADMVNQAEGLLDVALEEEPCDEGGGQ